MKLCKVLNFLSIVIVVFYYFFQGKLGNTNENITGHTEYGEKYGNSLAFIEGLTKMFNSIPI